jgi:hypothetical protein
MSMADIIPMKDAGRRLLQTRSPPDARMRGQTAEILFFTGVRYERRDDKVDNAGSRKSKAALHRKRDTAARS